MAWCWTGDKPLSEPMMVSLLIHICITWPQCVRKVIFKLIILNSSLDTCFENTLKILSGECHRTSLMRNQLWFRLWLGVIKQQAVTWNTVDSDLCRSMTSPGHNELNFQKLCLAKWMAFGQDMYEFCLSHFLTSVQLLVGYLCQRHDWGLLLWWPLLGLLKWHPIIYSSYCILCGDRIPSVVNFSYWYQLQVSYSDFSEMKGCPNSSPINGHQGNWPNY